jgi:sugar phosphate isomerase/epimerase
MSDIRAQESSSTDYPLGVFHFDLGRLAEDEAGQIKVLKSIGYSGLVLDLTTPKGLESLERYQAAISDDPFEVYAGYVSFHMDKDIDAQSAHLDKVIQGLKKSNAKFWLTLYARSSTPEREQVVEILRSAAERAKAAGVELIIYPHYGSLIESAEEAIPYLEEVQNGNVSLSLHLCHELRAGNGERLNEIAAKIKPWIAMPSINGADIDAVNEVGAWDKSIKPLTLGDYDASKLLEALKSVDYKGPVILHTYGLQKSAANHHHTSFKRFQEMVEKL